MSRTSGIHFGMGGGCAGLIGGKPPPTFDFEVRPKSWTPIQLLGLFHEQVHDAVQAFRHYCFS